MVFGVSTDQRTGAASPATVVDRSVDGLQDAWVIGQIQIVIGAKMRERLGPAGYGCRLRARTNAEIATESVVVELLEGSCQPIERGLRVLAHGVSLYCLRTQCSLGFSPGIVAPWMHASCVSSLRCRSRDLSTDPEQPFREQDIELFDPLGICICQIVLLAQIVV